MKGRIYIIKNDLNNKVYIGQTVQREEDRFKHHCKQKTDDHFHRALRKYGKEHFYVELLEECEIGDMSAREIYWIAKYDSCKNGYNSTSGGEQRPHIRVYTDSNMQQQMIDLYINKGYTTRKLGEMYNLDKSTVGLFLKSAGVKLRVQQNFELNDEEFNELLEMYNTGYSLKALGREYGVDSSTIKRCLVNHGIEIKQKYNILEHPEDIKNMLNEWTTTDIHLKSLMKKYHVSYTVFKRIMDNSNIEFSKKHYKLSDEDQDEIVAMFYDGIKAPEIAKKYNVDKGTIYSIFKRYNVPYLKTV